MANAEKQRTVTIDSRFGAHSSFFDHAWAKEFSDLTKDGPLDEVGFNLLVSWKGAANTARLPWLTVHLLGQFVESYMKSPGEKQERLISLIADRLCGSVVPPLDASQRRSLARAANTFSADIARTLAANPFHFDEQQWWKDLIGVGEFTLSVVASQQLAFAAVYYGYEDFLVGCFKLLRGIDQYRISGSFPDELAQMYSPVLAQHLWSDSDVRIARLVRHAIAHNGGRETKDLRNLQHGIPVADGLLQITAPLVRAEYECLKGRTSRIASETLARLPVK